jgi:hypothetical protein
MARLSIRFQLRMYSVDRGLGRLAGLCYLGDRFTDRTDYEVTGARRPGRA